jgi:hypothetical protein
VDATALPVCHNRRIARHKVFAGLAARGKTSMGWFFGFKLHLVFNHEHEIVALKLTPGNVSDTAPVISLVKGLTGKLFGDKGYIGRKLANTPGEDPHAKQRSHLDFPIPIPDSIIKQKLFDDRAKLTLDFNPERRLS